MLEAPNILKATTDSDRNINIQFDNGINASFNFERYFTYTGYYAFLSDIKIFKNVQLHANGNYIFWMNESNEEIEIDPSILYSICTQEKIIVGGKIVFDPSLGKEAWL